MAIDTPEDYKPLPKKAPQGTMDFSEEQSSKQADYTKELMNTSSAIAVTKDFDTLFEKYRDDIPLSFLKALAYKASGMNPNKNLFGISLPAAQVIKADAAAIDLADPVLNTKAAVRVVKNIVDYFAANYPTVLTRNWTSSDYVSLVAHAYNVGYKEGGLGKAMQSIYKTDKSKLNFDNVVAVAKTQKLAEQTYNPKFTAFAKDVANIMLTQPTQLPGPSETLPLLQARKRGFGGLGIAALVGVPFMGILLMSKGK